jgi:uncharacterized protein YdhG (YjbR/CyaY superfamily)
MQEDVAAYFNAASPQRRERLLALHELIVRTLPAAELSLGYRMPTYKTASGWVAIANQKSYVSLYTCSAAHIADFKAKHSQLKTGTGCINFRDKDPLPMQDIAAVVRHAAGSHR